MRLGKPCANSPTVDFYRDLLDELVVDFEVVEKEHDEFKYTLTDLEKLETEYLDMDGIWRVSVRRFRMGRTSSPITPAVKMLYLNTHPCWKIYLA